MPSSLLKFDFWLFKGYAPIVNGTVDSQRVTSMDKLDDNNDKDSKKDINDNKMPTIKVRNQSILRHFDLLKLILWNCSLNGLSQL